MSRGLLGVGDGLVKPDWLGRSWRDYGTQEERERSAQQKLDAETQEEPLRDTLDTRNSRLVRENVSELESTITPYTQAVDLANITANSTSQVDITVTEERVVWSGDYVIFCGADTLNHGLIVQGSLPAPSDNTIRIRVSNVTAGAIDAGSMNFHFISVHQFDPA